MRIRLIVAAVFAAPILYIAMSHMFPALGVPLYTDARLYGEAGIPVVLYGAGPRTVPESNAKRADENLLLEDLRKATQVVACAVAELLTA